MRLSLVQVFVELQACYPARKKFMYPKLATKHVLINVYDLGKKKKKLQMVTMVNYMLHIFYHIKKNASPIF